MQRRCVQWGIGWLVSLVCSLAVAQSKPVQTVEFDSLDGKTTLTGYIYQPDGPGPFPVIVGLHGRSGLYSTKAKNYDAQGLSPRHVWWGKFWAERGYMLLYIDTFGPRGYPTGFAAGTIKERPPEINEITIRPLDAYGGLRYLQTRSDVLKEQIFLQGWSNGGSATLSSMAVDAPGKPIDGSGFKAAISIYPACTQVTQHYGQAYKTYAPVLLLIGSEDEEVKPANCDALARVAKGNGSAFDWVIYEGATHSYDTPTRSRQEVEANVQATQDTLQRAEAYFKGFRLGVGK